LGRVVHRFSGEERESPTFYSVARAALALGLSLALSGSLTACREQESNAPPPTTAYAEAVNPVAPAADGHQGPAASDGGEAPPSSSLISSPSSPAETIRLVNQLRRTKRLKELGAYVVPEHRPAVIELIQAVDQLCLDNSVLQDRIRASGAAASAILFDRSEVANIIGVFSADVNVIREEVHGDSAVVTVEVAGRVPLEDVRMTFADGRWMIRCDRPIPGLADELRNLGKALQRVGQAVQTRKLSVEEIQHELDFWQQPAMERIAKLVENAKRQAQASTPNTG